MATPETAAEFLCTTTPTETVSAALREIGQSAEPLRAIAYSSETSAAWEG